MANFEGHPFLIFKHKVKNIKKALSKWSRETYGDIFQQLSIREELMKIKEALFESDPFPQNRMVLGQAQAKLKKYIKYEEEYWRLKAEIKWFVEGDRNTRFFHNLVNGKRKRLQVRRIQNDEGEWLEEESVMAEEAVKFYQK